MCDEMRHVCVCVGGYAVPPGPTSPFLKHVWGHVFDRDGLSRRRSSGPEQGTASPLTGAECDHRGDKAPPRVEIEALTSGCGEARCKPPRRAPRAPPHQGPGVGARLLSAPSALCFCSLVFAK